MKRVVFGLESEPVLLLALVLFEVVLTESAPVIPGEGIPSNKTRQNIIGANHATSTGNKEGQRECKNEEALAVDPFPLFCEVQQFF